jgi:hypothetical protein
MHQDAEKPVAKSQWDGGQQPRAITANSSDLSRLSQQACESCGPLSEPLGIVN